MVQVHALAAEALADEVRICITKLDTVRASEMSEALGNCLQGMKRLREALVMFPDVECDDGKGTGT